MFFKGAQTFFRWVNLTVLKDTAKQWRRVFKVKTFFGDRPEKCREVIADS